MQITHTFSFFIYHHIFYILSSSLCASISSLFSISLISLLSSLDLLFFYPILLPHYLYLPPVGTLLHPYPSIWLLSQASLLLSNLLLNYLLLCLSLYCLFLATYPLLSFFITSLTLSLSSPLSHAFILLLSLLFTFLFPHHLLTLLFFIPFYHLPLLGIIFYTLVK